MKGIGIKYQLRLTTLIPVLLVAILFSLFFNGQYAKDLKQQTYRLGKAYIHQLLPGSQLALMRKDKRTLQGLINASTINPDIEALAFYDAKGKLLAYRGGKYSLVAPFTPPPYKGEYIESKVIDPYTVNFISPITLPQYNFYTTDLKKTSPDSEIIGWLSISIDKRSMLLKKYQMYITSIFITLIGLLTSLTIHYFLSRRIYIPIFRLRRSMRQILNNVFDAKISQTSLGEIGEIERGSAYLQQHYLNTVRELNHHIETATADLQQSLELVEEKNIELTLEKKKMEEQCQHNSEFLANMSHEIRTPMNGVIGFTNVLLESKLDPLQLDYVKTIKSSAQDLLVIINDILDYSKIDSGKLHLDCIPVDIRACIDEIFTLAAPQAHKKNIDLIPISEPDVPRKVLGDPLRIKQILSNLINNAIKFTEKGHVLVRTSVKMELDNAYVLSLAVIDTGIGISEKDQQNLFTAFNQADTTITRRFGGTGLGLVISQKLAQAMHGQIFIDSKPKQGSTFTVTITLEKLEAYETEKSKDLPFAGVKILCYEDHPLHLEALTRGLSYLGVDCIFYPTLSTLEESLLEGQKADAAFINVNEETLKKVSPVIKKQPTPVVLLTKSILSNPEMYGAKAFLFKPIGIQKLQETLELLQSNNTTKTIDDRVEALRKQLKGFHPHLLIAEDNPVNTMLLDSLLRNYATLTLAADGEEALHYAQEKNFDMILLDLNMPKLNGLEAARRIRQQALYNKATPLILISANNEMPAEILRQEGITSFIPKPIEEKALLHILLTILEKTRNAPIDWNLCVQKVSGNPVLAQDFLQKFVEELQNNREEFLHLFEKEDIKGLESAAHKLKGACCFCGVPRLHTQVTQLEKQAKAGFALNALKPTFIELIQHIDEICDEFEAYYK